MSGIDELEVIGGAHGAGERMRVQVEELFALAQQCRAAGTRLQEGFEHLRRLTGAAQREIAASLPFISPAATVRAGFQVGVLDAPWLSWGSDSGNDLTSFSAALSQAAGSYERVERDNTIWEPAGDGIVGSTLMGAHAVEAALLAGMVDNRGTLGQFLRMFEPGHWALRPSWMGANLAGFRHLISSTALDPEVRRIAGHGEVTPNAVNPAAPAAAWLAGLYPDQSTDISGVTAGASRQAPSTLAEMYDSLSWKEEKDGVDAPPGRVVVQHLRGTGQDGTDRYIVSLPGTTDWELPGMDDKNDIRDVQGIGRGLSAQVGAEVAALPQALAKAGVPAGATIALVGHSLGGINAARAASDPTMRSRYRIAHVLTAGSPIQGIRLPAHTRLLAMVNRADVVPAGSGAPDRDTATSTTVRFSTRGEAAKEAGSHSMDTYKMAASAVDEQITQARVHGAGRDASRSILDVDNRLRADGFLTSRDRGSAAPMVSVSRVELSHHVPPSRPVVPPSLAELVGTPGMSIR